MVHFSLDIDPEVDMAELPASVPGGLVTALHVVLRARKKKGAWYALSRFLPTLNRKTQGRLHLALERALERMREESPREAELLRRRYWQSTPVKDLARQWNIADSTLYVWQRKAIHLLAHYLWLLEQEEKAQIQKALAFKMRHLPPATYTRLFGVDAWLKRLETWLLAPDGPRIVFLEGLGGLGKTTLAHAFVHRSLHHWDDVAWLSAYAHHPTWEEVQQPLNAHDLIERLAWQMGWSHLARRPPPQRIVELRIQLAQGTYLVVWDDLLPATIYQLISLLPPPSAQTRFLITTRYRLPHPIGAHLPLKELKRKPALALLRYEARQRGLPRLSSQVLEMIYARLGGNPLALKLAVAHLAFFPVNKVCEHLRDLPRLVDEKLFAHIYHPLVEQLPEHAFAVLQAMPYFAPEGATYQDLQDVTRLPHTALDDALYRLVYMGLLDFDPRPPPRYVVHRLTYTYLAETPTLGSNHG